MGFYHPSTLVKDAQRRGVRFHPIDVQISGWDCTVEADGTIRLGLRYVKGLREQAGRAIADRQPSRPSAASARQAAKAVTPKLERSTSEGGPRLCPKCGCDDASMIETTDRGLFCNVCSNAWWGGESGDDRASPRFRSVDDLITRAGLRRDEVVTLA